MDFGHYLVEAHLKGPIGRFVSERPRAASQLDLQIAGPL